MFPIHSMSGRVLGFGGRILTTDKKAAKYLNSPESEFIIKVKFYMVFIMPNKALQKKIIVIW